MDNFMDKLAQRFTAQEMIKANSAADAAELERLQKQLAQYDACLQEMRKLTLKNSEAMEQLQALVSESEQKLSMYKTEEGKYSSLQDKCNSLEVKCESLQQLSEEIKTIIQGLNIEVDFDPYVEQVNDFVHKENVKVYRNVQAVVVEELGKQSESFETARKKASKKHNAILTFTILMFLGVLADIALTLLIHFQIF